MEHDRHRRGFPAAKLSSLVMVVCVAWCPSSTGTGATRPWSRSRPASTAPSRCSSPYYAGSSSGTGDLGHGLAAVDSGHGHGNGMGGAAAGRRVRAVGVADGERDLGRRVLGP